MLDKLIRDITKTPPMAKSEARDRVKEYVESLLPEELPPFSADPNNPLKHVYQNEGFEAYRDQIIKNL